MGKPKCPLLGVHNRLNEAHKFWHDMLSGYQNPENFRISLNAAIQALRNVTFLLQSNKSTIPDFDEWYEKYRDAMKSDDILKWLHQARNIIVKQEDLELHSIASARVGAWGDVSRLEFQISPFITTEQIAKDLVRMHVVKAPEQIADHAILNVERKWVVNDLPNHELLDVIARGYKFFERLTADAHQQAELDLGICSSTYGTNHENPFAPCMSVTRDDRSANIKISTQKLFPKVEFDHINKESSKYRESVERYSKIEPPLPRHVDDLFEFVKVINERAKQMLAMDKGHNTIFIFCYPDGSYNPMEVRADDKSEQFILIRSVADQVRRTRANGVIAISEVWVIPENKRIGYKLPADHPEKEEALQVSAVSKNKVFILNTFFSRDESGNIFLGGTHEMELRMFNLMEPIIEALKSVG